MNKKNIKNKGRDCRSKIFSLKSRVEKTTPYTIWDLLVTTQIDVLSSLCFVGRLCWWDTYSDILIHSLISLHLVYSHLL